MAIVTVTESQQLRPTAYALACGRASSTFSGPPILLPAIVNDPATMPSFNLGAPINTALLLYILYAVQRILFPPASAKAKSIPTEFKHGYSWMPKAHPPTVLFTTYTPKTLAPFNGKDGGRILLAIDGTVFDVTAGRNFYGPSEFY